MAGFTMYRTMRSGVAQDNEHKLAKQIAIATLLVMDYRLGESDDSPKLWMITAVQSSP